MFQYNYTLEDTHKFNIEMTINILKDNYKINKDEKIKLHMTPVARLAQYIRERHETNESFENMVTNLQQTEKDNIKRAVLYSLDEDGHTGDWKLAFAEKYYL